VFFDIYTMDVQNAFSLSQLAYRAQLYPRDKNAMGFARALRLKLRALIIVGQSMLASAEVAVIILQLIYYLMSADIAIAHNLQHSLFIFLIQLRPGSGPADINC
jgi:hypothetical protein